MKNPKALVAGAVLSAVLLLALMLVRAAAPAVLEIPAAWLGIAVLPVVLGLVAGGYVKSFKGFGIEVEAALSEAAESELTAEAAQDYDPFTQESARDVADAEAVMMKGSMPRLERMSASERASFERLSFRQSYGGYAPGAIEQHLEKLPNVRWIEVDDPAGDFLGVIRRRDVEQRDLHAFIEALEDGTVLDRYPSVRAADAVRPDTPLREVALRLKRTGAAALPVTRDGQLLGMIERAKVHERIGAAVARSLE